MAVVMVFVDGVGLGPADPAVNPLVEAEMPTTRQLLDGASLVAREDMIVGQPMITSDEAVLVPVDARLGVDGLPQSATGQTTLLTGVNASEVMSRHVSGVPTPTLTKILRAESIFKQLTAAGRTATFANPFTEQYFAAVDAGRMRLSATTTALLSADLPPRMLDDLHKGRAVFHDITGEGLRDRGHAVRPISPVEAGKSLARLARDYDFTLFEHFLTDMAGHAQDEQMALRLLNTLDTFLAALLSNVDLDETLVLVISDHGNIEDLSVKTHTFNPVPALLVGKGKESFAARLRSLTDVTPAVLEHLEVGMPADRRISK